MTERAYTVKEIDDLLKVCERRWLWGTSALGSSPRMSRGYSAGEKEKGAHEMARTFMLAGLTADDIITEDERAAQPQPHLTS